MSLLSDIMREQMRLYHEAKAEPWLREHLAVKDCWALEDVLGFGLNMYDRFKRIGERRIDALDRGHGDANLDWPFDEQLAKALKAWLDISLTYLPAIDACERAGFNVENAVKFREACRNVSLMVLDVDRVRRSFDSLESGRGQPMEKALDELRDRIR